MRRNGRPWPLDGPVPTVAAGGTHHALLMRNNRGGAEMVTPTGEPARTVTTKGHQSLLVPYNGTGQARPADRPLGTQPANDRWSLIDTDRLVDDCGFRMLEPHEIAAAMALPAGYIPATLTKKYRTRLAGNAVTPPVMAWITGRVARALHEAAA
jgi:DNA (cytosine-5)-methyltransferase 1